MKINKLLNSNVGALTLIILLGVFVYSFMLGSPFKTMDDQYSIVNNSDIKSFGNIKKIFTTSFFGGDAYYRPLVSLSFMSNYAFSKDNPFFYNLTNLVVHLLTAIAVFFLLKRLLEDHFLGLLSALLFTIHPLHWEAVSNIPGRAILLCGMFVVYAFLFFLKSQDENSIKAYLISIISFVLALLSKESACMLAVVITFYVLLIKEKDIKIRIKRFIPLIPFWFIVFCYLLLRRSLGITQMFKWRNFQEHVLGVATFLRGALTFLRMFILPVDMHFDRSRMLFVSYRNTEFLVTVLFYCAITFLLIKYWRQIDSRVKFFIFWFWIELFPVSQIVTSIGVQGGYISIAEHFLYVSSIGIFALLILFGRWVYKKNEENQIITSAMLKVFFLAAYIILSVITIEQCVYASSEYSMFEQTLKYDPHNVRIRNSLALGLAGRGHFKQAEEYFRKVLDVEPFNARARIALGKSLCDQGRYWQGIKEYEQVRKPGKFKALLKENLSLSYNILISKYNDRILKEPQNADIYYSLGIVCSKTGKLDEAIEQYAKAIAIDPYHKNALFNAASIFESDEKWEKAIVFYARMVKIKGKNDDQDKYAYGHLSKIYSLLGDEEKSLECAISFDEYSQKNVVKFTN